ncbi:PREDICTED: tumor-associated calcium signal transducer 2-like, partial [Merops nubicus]|uniref:tumor-associated calcium signal transducer 2-like n=1 Tax=Merops nubicus TaxID=57421 RepID=UPI0004F01B11
MEPVFGALLGLILAVASAAQSSCTCVTNKGTVCAQHTPGNCTLVASKHEVSCSPPTPKGFLVRAEMTSAKEKGFWGHRCGLLDNDGFWNPDCEESGVFKVTRRNQPNTCCCVAAAGVRLGAEKGDKSPSCGELVTTTQIYVELRHNKRTSAFDVPDLANALRHLFESRYKLHPRYITARESNSPRTQARLNQHKTSRCDADTAHLVYYFEK